MSNTLRSSTTVFVLAGLVACGGKDDGEVPARLDRDGDGISDTDEAYLGSNPDEADTDHDGYDDLAEVEGNTDPLNGFDHPYAGGWTIAACRDDVAPTGNAVGAVAEDFALMDQHLDIVRLHSFCDRVVVLATAAVWCQPCQTEAAELQVLYQTYGADRLMPITLLGEDGANQTPSHEALNEWADLMGITYPVLQDPSFDVSQRFTGSATVLPLTHVIDRGMVVAQVNGAAVDRDFLVSLLSD